jgi:hypothetical protein
MGVYTKDKRAYTVECSCGWSKAVPLIAVSRDVDLDVMTDFVIMQHRLELAEQYLGIKFTPKRGDNVGK